MSSTQRSLTVLKEIKIEEKKPEAKIFPCAEFYALKHVLTGPKSPLKDQFSQDELDYLYREDPAYKPKIITRRTLLKYFPPKKVEEILNGDTPFFDKVKQYNYGKFEIQFADKLLELMQKKRVSKETKFNFEIKMSPVVNGYDIRFMTDEEYKDGLMFYFGEIANNCESIGKSGGDLCLFDAFSNSARTFLIRKDGQLVGQSPVFINGENDVFVIASMICTPSTDTKIIKTLTEYFACRLMELNPEAKQVTIGIGGANLVSLGFKCFTRHPKGAPKEFISLGKIRHSSDLTGLEADVAICQKAIGYPILPEYDSMGPPELRGFLQSTTGARKDFFRVASLVDRDNLVLKKEAALANIKKINLKLESKNARPSRLDHTQQRLKNMTPFLEAISKLIAMVLPRHKEITVNGEISSMNSKALCFTIALVPKGKDATSFVEILYDFSGGAIKPTVIEQPETILIKFTLPLGYFGIAAPADPHKKNQFWKVFCDKVDIKSPVRSISPR